MRTPSSGPLVVRAARGLHSKIMRAHTRTQTELKSAQFQLSCCWPFPSWNLCVCERERVPAASISIFWPFQFYWRRLILILSGGPLVLYAINCNGFVSPPFVIRFVWSQFVCEPIVKNKPDSLWPRSRPAPAADLLAGPNEPNS